MSQPESDTPEPEDVRSLGLSDYGTVRVDAITDDELGDDEAAGAPVADYERWDLEGGGAGDTGDRSGIDGVLGRFGRTAPLVILVSKAEVEVLAPRGADSAAAEVAGDARLIQFSHELPLGKALAQFIVSTLKEHGVARSAIRLAFSHEILPARIIEVPNLTPRDLEPVMGRRSSALIDASPGEVAYSALALDGPDQAERRWLVHPMLAKPLIAMQMELRSLGWTVRDVVPARTAPFLLRHGPEKGATEKASPEMGSAGQATLTVVFDRDAVGIGLVAGGRLVHHSTLPGSLESHLGEPGARSLVQELRGVDAFWRRSSRGDQVSEILILGAVPSALEVLAPPIRAALGDVRVAGAVGAGAQSGLATNRLRHETSESRIDLLRAIRGPRAVNLDLSLPLPPRSRSILTVALSSLVVCFTIASGMRDGMDGLTSSISTEALVVATASQDLEELRERNQEVLALQALLQADCDRLTSLEGLGVSATPIVAGLRRAFGDQTRLLSMRAMGLAVGSATVSRELGEVGTLQVRGLVLNAPGETMSALNRLHRGLEAVPGVVSVAIEPPSLNDRGPADQFGPGSQSLRFMATARLVIAGSEEAYRDAVLAGSAGGLGAGPGSDFNEPLPGGE